MPVRDNNLNDPFAGLLLGTAVGDALGLPAENLSAEKIRKRWQGRWRMRFILGRGMVSPLTLKLKKSTPSSPSSPSSLRNFPEAV